MTKLVIVSYLFYLPLNKPTFTNHLYNTFKMIRGSESFLSLLRGILTQALTPCFLSFLIFLCSLSANLHLFYRSSILNTIRNTKFENLGPPIPLFFLPPRNPKDSVESFQASQESRRNESCRVGESDTSTVCCVFHTDHSKTDSTALSKNGNLLIQ